MKIKIWIIKYNISRKSVYSLSFSDKSHPYFAQFIERDRSINRETVRTSMPSSRKQKHLLHRRQRRQRSENSSRWVRGGPRSSLLAAERAELEVSARFRLGLPLGRRSAVSPSHRRAGNLIPSRRSTPRYYLSYEYQTRRYALYYNLLTDVTITVLSEWPSCRQLRRPLELRFQLHSNRASVRLARVLFAQAEDNIQFQFVQY